MPLSDTPWPFVWRVVYGYYGPPRTPDVLRRNEMILPVEDVAGPGNDKE